MRRLVVVCCLAVVAYLFLVMYLGYLGAVHGGVHGAGGVAWGLLLIMFLGVTCAAAVACKQWKALGMLVLVAGLVSFAVLSGEAARWGALCASTV